MLLGSLSWLAVASHSGRGSLLLLGVLQIELFVLDQVQLPAYEEFLLLGAARGVRLPLLLRVGVLHVAQLLGVEGFVDLYAECVMAGQRSELLVLRSSPRLLGRGFGVRAEP